MARLWQYRSGECWSYLQRIKSINQDWQTYLTKQMSWNSTQRSNKMKRKRETKAENCFILHLACRASDLSALSFYPTLSNLIRHPTHSDRAVIKIKNKYWLKGRIICIPNVDHLPVRTVEEETFEPLKSSRSKRQVNGQDCHNWPQLTNKGIFRNIKELKRECL